MVRTRSQNLGSRFVKETFTVSRKQFSAVASPFFILRATWLFSVSSDSLNLLLSSKGTESTKGKPLQSKYFPQLYCC